MNNIFEVSFNEEGALPGKDIFEEGFKFAASEAKKKFDSTYLSDQGAIGERSGSDRGVSDQPIAGNL